ncbi:MAG: DUF1553 domain-containing protein [Planctomycetes bacterium]|nr:DUF1553 domain-containing protein [Planctomycetota bacterium]
MRYWTSTATLAALLLLPNMPATGNEKPAPRNELSRYDARIKPADRKHWAFQPIRRRSLPSVSNKAWVRNPIDAFVLAKLESRGWAPSPPAERRVLLRRIHIDLVGLPPTPAEQRAFLNDDRPDAIDHVVESLLASPRHGERWGRHWLDVVRYAETAGYERDAAKPHVWRYRDYVIRAFNDDKPFDRFLLEQVAGDELPDADAETMIASGFHRLGPWDDEPADPDEDRFDQLDDMVNTTSMAFLGLTMGCARCHDHKLEPLTMHDYYRMVAIFNPLRRPQAGRTELDMPAGSRRELALWSEKEKQLRPLVARADAIRKSKDKDKLAEIEREIDKVRREMPPLPRGYFMHEPSGVIPATHIMLRGKASRPGPEVRPGFPTVIVSKQPEFPQPNGTSQRRLTLARWMASPDNPLTARVIVNRVWQWHFGEGLVRTPSDFGTAGDRPSHPELLDWLTSRFIEDGWSLKKLHRLILDSNSYRMSKKWRAEQGKADPENRYLWRFPYRRLEVEAIRDSMLAVSGQLNGKMYGPWMYPEVPKDALAGSSDPDKIWRPFDETEASRRTVYAHIKRSFVVPLLEVLDLCDTTRTSEKRLVTTVAPQALTLFNGSFANRQAAHFAARLQREAGDNRERQVRHAYELALCRPPTEPEMQRMLRFLAEGTDQRALVQMCRVILNLNEFVYPD